MLYPKSNKYRDLYNLNGVWKFALVDENFEPKTALVDYALMPVREKRAYHVRVEATSHKAIDECEFCIGEHVWNLFDFKTKQGLTRVRGNRKGIFTKDRQPKASAFFLKNRWKNK